MSDDEIVFGEVDFREPSRTTRPDRDPRFACVACQTPDPDDLPIYFDAVAADAVERHALSDATVELGGVLLGKECVDPASGRPFVWITRTLEARHYANTQASFTYTHDSWEEITRERERLFPDLDVVGWYHTHPGFGIFLSHHDLFIHNNFFARPWQTAYVVDPIQGTRGFFQWSEGETSRVGGFHLCAERSERVALSRLADQLEDVPGAQASGGGGSLSPRLEAELIKMLNRPAPPTRPVAGEGLALAALLGFLGSLALVAATALGVWLYRIDARTAEQTVALATLRREVEEAAPGRKLAMDMLLEKIGGETPELFVERYDKLARSRDEARAQAAARQSAAEALGLRVQELKASVATLSSDLESAREAAAGYKDDAEEAPALRERVAALEREGAEQRAEIQDQRAILETAEGAKAEATYRMLNAYKAAAYAGGLASLILGVAAVFLYVRTPTAEGDGPRRGG